MKVYYVEGENHWRKGIYSTLNKAKQAITKDFDQDEDDYGKLIFIQQKDSIYEIESENWGTVGKIVSIDLDARMEDY